MCNNKECADYFKRQKEYHRCLIECKKKWQSYGKPAGKIKLSNTSKEERQAIGGILSKVFYEENISFSFAEFERGLQKTRFAPLDIKSVLEEYFGEKLITTKSRIEEKEKKKQRFFKKIYRRFEEESDRDKTALLWLGEMISGKKYGYNILMREYERDEIQAEVLIQNIKRALVKIKELSEGEDECPLAVLAAQISDNPHYFDKDTSAGLLLIHAICYIKKEELPQNAHRWREVLEKVCIAPDNISSMVHAFGLRLLTKDGRHPAYDAFCDRREACVITMENMKGVVAAKAYENKLYVVENEMVFSYLINNVKYSKYSLLCTSGQPRAVAQVLITYILDAKVKIFYNGDIDPDGIRIADRLWKKFGDNIHIWRMTPKDYERSISKEKIGELGRAKLENITHPVLKKTAECIKERRLAGYQENMLKELLFDIENRVMYD